MVIPVYNVEKYIEECFESIMKQLPGADMEIICVDDGSIDASGAIRQDIAVLLNDKNTPALTKIKFLLVCLGLVKSAVFLR